MVNVARKGEACVVARCPSPLFRPASGEGFEPDDDILTVFERFEVVEIEATDSTALGIEVDVTDHEAVTSMVARVGVGSMSWSRMRAAVVVGPWIPRPAPSIRRSYSLSPR